MLQCKSIVTTDKPRFHGNQRMMFLLIPSLQVLASFKTSLPEFRAVKFRYFLCKEERHSKESPKNKFCTYIWPISIIFVFVICCSLNFSRFLWSLTPERADVSLLQLSMYNSRLRFFSVQIKAKK